LLPIYWDILIEVFDFIGGLYWTRTSDLSHVKGTRYQLRQETFEKYFRHLYKDWIAKARSVGLH
jgi:hypothetical protein